MIVRRQGAGIVAARSSREVARLEAEPESGRKCLAFAYNDYPDENIWNTIHMIAQYTRQHGCNLLDCKIYPDTPTETILNLVQSRTDCAGLVLLFGSDRMDREQLEALGRLPMRVVAVDSMFFYSDFLPDNVYVLSPDGADCAEKMAEVLVRRGHRRIGYIRNEPRSEYTDLHLKAFGAALKRAGVEFGPEQIFSATIRSWENALDAAISFFNMVNALRQQTREDARLHGIIVNGGSAPNVVPDYTEIIYSARANKMAYLETLTDKVVNCIKAAALGTGCRVEYEKADEDFKDTNSNQVLADLNTRQMEALGVTVQRSAGKTATGSSDLGDVSYVCPSIQSNFNICGDDPKGAHTPEFAELAGTEAAMDRGLLYVEGFVMTAIELMREPKYLKAIKAEFEKK